MNATAAPVTVAIGYLHREWSGVANPLPYWPQIIGWHGLLMCVDPSPIVALNQAAAMRLGRMRCRMRWPPVTRGRTATGSNSPLLLQRAAVDFRHESST